MPPGANFPAHMTYERIPTSVARERRDTTFLNSKREVMAKCVSLWGECRLEKILRIEVSSKIAGSKEDGEKHHD